MDATPDQLPLFPTDRTSDLSRALLDTAYLVVQARSYLSDEAVADLFGSLAYFRERLTIVTHAERLTRDLTAKPRFGPVARPVAPPTIARLAG